MEYNDPFDGIREREPEPVSEPRQADAAPTSGEPQAQTPNPGEDRVLTGETGAVSGAYRFGPGSFVTNGGGSRVYTYTRPGGEPVQPSEPIRPSEPAGPTQTVRPAQAGAPGGQTGGTYGPWAYPNWGQAAQNAVSYGQPAYPGAAYGPVRREPVRPAAEGREIRRSRWWIPLVIVGALAMGLIIGVFGLRDRTGSSRTPTAPTSPSAPAPIPSDTDPISDRIEYGEVNGEYHTPAQIYRENVNSVVGISKEGTVTNIWGQETPVASSGTGFILSEDGYILTNYHVVKEADTLTVSLYDGRTFPAALVGYESTTCDVALLKIDAQGLTPVKIGDSDALQVGDPVCTIGNPLGELTYTLTVGYVSAKERAVNSDGSPISMLQTDAAINNGNSGGPLFDFAGNVVGIVTAKASGTTSSGAAVEGLGFAIPINAVMNMIDDLKLYGRAENRAYLGVKVGDASQVPDRDLPNGAYISSVEAGYCAEAAGMQAGDVVVGLDGRTIRSYTDLLAEIQSHTAGQSVELQIWRAGETLTLTVTFDARPRE